MTKIIVPIDLGEYHEAYAGRYLYIWVNPPIEKMLEHENLISDYAKVLSKIIACEAADWKTEISIINDKVFAWRAEIWSQAIDPASHWDVSDIQTLREADPAFYEWLKRRTDESFLRQHLPVESI